MSYTLVNTIYEIHVPGKLFSFKHDQIWDTIVFCDDETDLPTCLAMRGDPFTKAALYFWPVSFFV